MLPDGTPSCRCPSNAPRSKRGCGTQLAGRGRASCADTAKRWAMRESALYVTPVAHAQEQLEALVRECRAGDRLTPVTVVAPTTHAALFLRRDMGRRGLANVRFMVLPRLAELLGAPRLAARGLKPLTPLIESAAVRRAAGEAVGRLEPFRHHSSFHSSLRRTFRELRHVDENTVAALERNDGLPGRIIELYRRFIEFTKGYYDRESLAEAAAEAVRNGNATVLSDLGPVIAYLAHGLTLGERRLFDTLGTTWSCSMVFGATGDDEADAAMLVDPAPREARTHEPRSTRSPVSTESRLLIASDSREEVRSVARAIAAAAHEGTPFHRMAVLYWQREPYASLIAGQLGMAGVPTAGPPPERLASTAVGRMVKGIVGLADGKLTRNDVMRWLTACPIKSWPRSFRPSRWDAISRDAGVVAGIEHWRDRLELHANRLKRSASDQSEDIPDAKRRKFMQTSREARALRAFMERLHDRLTPPDDGRAWSDFVAWVAGLIERYLDRDALPSTERDNLDILRAGLREMEGLDDMENVATLDGFRAGLDEVLSLSAARKGALGEGVFLGPVESAIGLRFDTVYLVGMIEGLVPPRVRADPLLPDRERAAAGLPVTRGTAAERYIYLAAAVAGRARVLTFARGDGSAQKAQQPSRWFLEEASRLNGSQVFASQLACFGGSPWLETVQSQEAGLRTIDRSQPADLHDYDLHRLWRWRHSGRRIADHHLAASETVLARSLRMERAREAGPLTIWDGDLSAESRSSKRIGLSDGEVFSPTRLETWATCPYRYFLSNVLGIAALEEPEEVASISPLERGSLIHRILERFIREAQEQGTLPRPDQPWSDDHLQRLTAISGEEFRNAEERGTTGKPLLWEIARTEILGDLHMFLEEDFEMRQTYEVSPHSLELAFETPLHEHQDASADTPVEWSSRETGPLRFRGVIDRIDVSPSGEAALVIDYKTGRMDEYTNMDREPVRRGTRLQLPVYGLAARQLFGDSITIRAAYWFVSARERFSTRPGKPKTIDEMLKPFTASVKVITDGIHNGLFPANPGKSNAHCRYCDFTSLCPTLTRRKKYWDRKRSDPSLADYVSMAVGDQSEEGQ